MKVKHFKSILFWINCCNVCAAAPVLHKCRMRLALYKKSKLKPLQSRSLKFPHMHYKLYAVSFWIEGMIGVGVKFIATNNSY